VLLPVFFYLDVRQRVVDDVEPLARMVLIVGKPQIAKWKSLRAVFKRNLNFLRI